MYNFSNRKNYENPLFLAQTHLILWYTNHFQKRVNFSLATWYKFFVQLAGLIQNMHSLIMLPGTPFSASYSMWIPGFPAPHTIHLPAVHSSGTAPPAGSTPSNDYDDLLFVAPAPSQKYLSHCKQCHVLFKSTWHFIEFYHFILPDIGCWKDLHLDIVIVRWFDGNKSDIMAGRGWQSSPFLIHI